MPIVPQQCSPVPQLSEPEHVSACPVHAMAVVHDSAPRAPMQHTWVAGSQSRAPASSRPQTMRSGPASPVIPPSPVDPLDEPLLVPLLAPEVAPLVAPEVLPDALPEVLPDVDPDPVPDEDPETDPDPDDDPVVLDPLVEPVVEEPDEPLDVPEDEPLEELPEEEPDPPSPLTVESEPPHPTATAVPTTPRVKTRRR